MTQQRNPVRAGNDLEGRDQDAPSGIPFNAHLRRIDRHRIIGRIAVDEVPGPGDDLAAQIGRHAIAPQFTLQLTGERQFGTVSEILDPHRQQDIGGRHFVGAKIDRPHAVLLRPDHDLERPWTRTVLAKAHCNPTAPRPAHAEADIFECPFVAALLVVDDEIAVLEADLVQILSVEAGQTEAIEPVEAGQQSILRGVGSGHNGTLRRRRPLARERRRDAGIALGGDARCQRLGGVAGGYRHLAVRRDSYREFGIDQIEAFGTQPSHQQRCAG